MTKSEYNNPDRPLRVLVSGGGTGGHIFPAVSKANEVSRRHPDAEILFVGAEGRMEMQRVPAAGYDIKGLPVAGFDRRRLWRNFAVLGKLWRSLRMANGILRDFRPDIAVGVGGYASGPMLKAAQRHGIPTLLQEQNGYPGVTNKLLAKKADAICVAYDNMDRWFPAARIVMTGNPVRAAITAVTATPAEAKKALGFDPGRPLVLSVGGSLGARTGNEAISAAIPQIDLPRDKVSGLKEACKVLEGVEDIAICRLTASDVVRHALVQKIVAAYDQYEKTRLPAQEAPRKFKRK